jgi:hypothetical protein
VADPLNGGRGIGMTLETLLINPLARELFDRPHVTAGATVTVTQFRQSANGTVRLMLDDTQPSEWTGEGSAG